VLSYLSVSELVNLFSVCRSLKSAAQDDQLWHAFVQANVPGSKVTKPFPLASFRDLYPAHDPFWFLPRHKIWFGDWDVVGKVVMVRYDQRRGCIEGCQLLATRQREAYRRWGDDGDIIIHEFEPTVRLHTDRPVLQLNPNNPHSGVPLAKEATSWYTPQAAHYFDDRVMPLGTGPTSGTTELSLARRGPNGATENQGGTRLDGSGLWPPSIIPSLHRVAQVPETFPRLDGPIRPLMRSQMSDQAFRLRRSDHFAPLGLASSMVTYSTLDPKLYTPTEQKPWRGIWVGDYSGHGCEFLLIHQPDETPDHDSVDDAASATEDGSSKTPTAELEQLPDESVEAFEARQKVARTYQGSLEAIKLTGDPNIPRGERTFYAKDLGGRGFVDTLTEEPFVGARVVKSRGHIAAEGFQRGKYLVLTVCASEGISVLLVLE
jgi:hypothetical protein